MLKKTQSSRPSLKRLLHAEIAHWDEPRSMHHIHASSVTSDRVVFCPRAWALMALHDVKPAPWFIGTAMQLTFDLGHATQQVITDQLLGKVLGDWTCLACAHRHEYRDYPGHCVQCGSAALRYDEIRVTSEYSGISCGLDLIVRFGPALTRLYELKIIDKDYFKKLKAPMAEHRRRTQLYLRCLAESDHPARHDVDLTEAGILYVGRTFGHSDDEVKEYPFYDQPFSNLKEYAIKRADDSTITDVEKARVLHRYRQTGHGFPCGVCDTPKSEPAKECPVRQQCFSGEHPWTVTWMFGDEPAHANAKLLP